MCMRENLAWITSAQIAQSSSFLGATIKDFAAFNVEEITDTKKHGKHWPRGASRRLKRNNRHQLETQEMRQSSTEEMKRNDNR
jgi:hypothetical protein